MEHEENMTISDFFLRCEELCVCVCVVVAAQESTSDRSVRRHIYGQTEMNRKSRRHLEMVT